MSIENVLEKTGEEEVGRVWDVDFCDGAYGERVGIINECNEFSEMYIIVGGGEVRAHEHKRRQEFYTVIEGQGNLKIGEETKHIKKGDKFYIGEGIVHSLERISGVPLILKVVCYPKYNSFDVVYCKYRLDM